MNFHLNHFRIVFALLFLQLISFSGFAQHTLMGKVSDDSTKRGLKDVAVFIPELNKGCYTADDGSFRLTDLHTGDIRIQFFYLGYESKIIEVEVHDSVIRLEVKLKLFWIESEEMVIYGNQSATSKETPYTIQSISQDEMRQGGAMSLSDGIAKMPGVSQMSTGPGISKPVIRGLYGNRIQTVLMGMPFDNQQWQDEHGLGLPDLGIDRVEVIKGPASLLYGSGAMGGVLNVIEEKPAPVGTIQKDVNFRSFSNTYGLAGDFGIKGATEKHNWRIRAGAESHGDYSDGNNKRIQNTRFGGYHLKASYATTKSKMVSVNNFMTSLMQFGFPMPDNMDKIPPHPRLARPFDGPKHVVWFGLYTSQNTFFRGKSKFRWNLGLHSNSRMENEGGNRISLNMLLNTLTSNFQWTYTASEKTEVSLGTQELGQMNQNFGSRVIIPDAMMGEASVFAFLHEKLKGMVVETGFRYDRRAVKTYNTPNLYQVGNEIPAFAKGYNALNGSLGFSVNDWGNWVLKANASSGYRSGNLAELAANGLHEGTNHWEKGDPTMKSEKNLNGEITTGYAGRSFSLILNGYYNYFLDYIYLAPTGTEYYGFPIYTYRQGDAGVRGAEARLDVNHPKVKWLDFSGSFSMIRGSLLKGNNLPFIPASRINGNLRFKSPKLGKLIRPFLTIGMNYVFSQNNPAQFETNTPAYYLFNAGAGTSISLHGKTMDIWLNCNNLLNATYYDHLSRFKYYGIYNMGRNINLGLHIPF